MKILVIFIRDIEGNINAAKQAITQYKEDLQQARVIRRHRQEYDALAMVRYTVMSLAVNEVVEDASSLNLCIVYICRCGMDANLNVIVLSRVLLVIL